MNNLWDVNQKMIDDYLCACKNFVENEDSFNNFKRDPHYVPVLEHLTDKDAELYYQEMKCIDKLTIRRLNQVKENDIYGNPILFEHYSMGTISPTTVRYVKNSLDIIETFSEQIPFNTVLEVGGGYGGLCKTFNCFNKFMRYYLVDFPEVNALSSLYLSKFSSLKNKIHHISTEDVKEVKEIDLFISNYAFSECSKEFQELYYDKFIKNSKNFYIVYNNFTQNNLSPDDFIQLAEKDFIITSEIESRPPHTVKILYGKKC
jgi:putative sugar O-methyltransferase